MAARGDDAAVSGRRKRGGWQPPCLPEDLARAVISDLDLIPAEVRKSLDSALTSDPTPQAPRLASSSTISFSLPFPLFSLIPYYSLAVRRPGSCKAMVEQLKYNFHTSTGSRPALGL